MQDCVNSPNKNPNSLLKYLKITQLEIPTFDHISDQGPVSVDSSYSPLKKMAMPDSQRYPSFLIVVSLHTDLRISTAGKRKVIIRIKTGKRKYLQVNRHCSLCMDDHLHLHIQPL